MHSSAQLRTFGLGLHSNPTDFGERFPVDRGRPKRGFSRWWVASQICLPCVISLKSVTLTRIVSIYSYSWREDDMIKAVVIRDQRWFRGLSFSALTSLTSAFRRFFAPHKKMGRENRQRQNRPANWRAEQTAKENCSPFIIFREWSKVPLRNQ